MRRFVIAAALGAALWTLSVPADAAASWMARGAGVLPSRYVLEASTGFPRTAFLFRIPAGPRVEVGPYLEMHYPGYGGFGGWWRGWGWNVGTALGARLRVNLLDRGPLQVALALEAGPELDFLPGLDAGLRLVAPEGLVSYEFNDRIGIYGGMKVPVTLMFVGFVHAYVPILLDVGAEFLVAPKIHVFVEVTGGPALRAGPSAFGVGGYAGFTGGVAIRLP